MCEILNINVPAVLVLPRLTYNISRIYRLLATCWYLSGVCALSSSRDIARYRSNSPIYTAHIKVNQPAYFMERNMDISRTTQCTNTGQVPACSQEPVDSTDANIVETSTCLETTQQETTNFTVRLSIESDWSMFSCAPECSKQLPLPKYIANWGGLGASYQC